MINLRVKSRRKYVMAMLKAIDLSAGRVGNSCYVNSCTRTAGLRCIKTFEKVNIIKFDPFNRDHVLKVQNRARFGEVIRNMNIFIKSRESKVTND